MNETWKQRLLESGEHLIHIECDNQGSDQIRDCLLAVSPLGIVRRQEAFYEDMKTAEYLRFFASLFRSALPIQSVMETMRLSTLARTPIEKLDYSQRRRLAIAREILHQAPVLWIEEPLLNLDESSRAVILAWLEQAVSTKIITTTVSLKLLYLLPGVGYTLDQGSLVKLENEADAFQPHACGKIPVKLEDKILVFDPQEIDYAESVGGKCRIVVHGSEFITPSTMEELEDRLAAYGFFRCHRSYLVNMEKVKELIRWTRNSYSLKLKTQPDVDIPLSKGRVDDLKRLWNL